MRVMDLVRTIKIKREILVGGNSLAFLISGLILLVFLFEELSRVGTIAYLSLWVFMVSSFWLWRHENVRKTNEKLIDETVNEVIQEYEDRFKNVPQVIKEEIQNRELLKEGFLDTQHLKTNLRKNLLETSRNETIKLDSKTIKGLLFELALVTIIFGAIVAFFSPK